MDSNTWQQVLATAGRPAPIAIADLQPGDLLFGHKQSFEQTLLLRVGDPWRHVAMVLAGADDELVVGEVTGAHTVSHRTIHEVLAYYDLVGIGRLGEAPNACTEGARRWIARHLEARLLYPWDDVILTGMLLVTRRALDGQRLDALAAALEHIVARTEQSRTRPAMTCSAFVYESFARTEGCTLQVAFDLIGAGDSPTQRDGARLDVAHLEQLNPRGLQTVLDEYSLWELVAMSGPGTGRPVERSADRGNRRSHASLTQLLQAARLVVQIVEEYGDAYDDVVATTGAGPAVAPSGRWVSPGDLWRSGSLAHRWYLTDRR